MPLRLVDSPNERPTNNNNNTLHQDQTNTASLVDSIQQSGHLTNNNNTNTATTTSVSTGGAEPTEAINPGSAPSPRRLTKEEADQLYEENIEEEYAKREGGA